MARYVAYLRKYEYEESGVKRHHRYLVLPFLRDARWSGLAQLYLVADESWRPAVSNAVPPGSTVIAVLKRANWKSRSFYWLPRHAEKMLLGEEVPPGVYQIVMDVEEGEGWFIARPVGYRRVEGPGRRSQ